MNSLIPDWLKFSDTIIEPIWNFLERYPSLLEAVLQPNPDIVFVIGCAIITLGITIGVLEKK